ncbi:hypothetical protein BDW74DRAFT_179992 [Aspergillus multicolor]|uniref:uncharacterized protein n=1 Tax=Aspergillus multicolor TaxID=41759 RepID=UPI003CCCADBE
MIWATMVGIAACVAGLLATSQGYGKHLAELTPAQNKSEALMNYAFICLFYAGISTTKLPVIALYYRILPSTTMRRIAITTGVVIVIWGITVLVLRGLVCPPAQDRPGACTKSLLHPAVLAFEPQILPWTTCSIEAGRIVLLAQNNRADFTYTQALAGILICWELLGSILCANLPIIYKPISIWVCRLLEISREQEGSSTSPMLGRFVMQRCPTPRHSTAGLFTFILTTHGADDTAGTDRSMAQVISAEDMTNCLRAV